MLTPFTFNTTLNAYSNCVTLACTYQTMTCRNVFNSNSSSSSPFANSSMLLSSSSFSHVRLARSNFRTAMLMAVWRHACTINHIPKCLLVALANSQLNSSPAHGPRLSANKYSDSRQSNTQANGRTYTKYCAII
jgi:hypothetical protein